MLTRSILIAVPLLFGSGVWAQREAARLTPNQALTVRLGPGETIRHALALEAGVFFEVEASADDLDLLARLMRPDGSTVFTVDLTAPPDPEIIMGVADADGQWTLEIEEVADASGVYQLLWTQRRVAGPKDSLRAASYSIWLQALQERAQGKAEAVIPMMEESVKLLEQAAGDSLPLADRLQGVALALLGLGEYARAEQIQRRSLDLLRNLAPEGWEDLAVGHQQLALALQAQGDYEAAADSMRESAKNWEKLRPAHFLRLAESYGALGGILYQLARYDEASQALRQAAEVLEGREDSADAMLAMILNNLAAVEETREDFATAETAYREALEIRRRIFGPDHEEVAVTLTNLGLLQERQGRYPEAEESLKESVRILETRLGPQHPQLGVALNNLAALNKLLGRLQEAEAIYNRVEAIFRQSHGEKHPDTAGVRGNLGNLFMTQGRFSEAQPHLEAALETLQEVAGRHPLTANALNNLGELYRSQARYGEAKGLFQQSLAMYEETLGRDSLRTSEARNNLAAMYVEQGRFAEAEAAFSELARLLEASLGENHPDLAIVLNNLGNVYLEQGRMVEAETALRRALDIWISHHGEAHANPANGMHNLARLYFETGRFEEAESMMNRALQIKLAVLEKDHPEIATTFDLRGDLHLDRGNLQAAVDDFRASLDLSERALGSDHPQTAVASGKLGRALFKSGRLEEARSLLERSIHSLSQSKSFPESLIRNYAALARLQRLEGDPETAVNLLASALDEAERQRPGVGGGEETRSEFWERLADEFDLMVEWQIEAGNPEAAFEYAERSRARALLDQLSLSGVDLRRSLPPDVAERLAQRESRIRAVIAELQQRIRFSASRQDLDAAQRENQIRELNERLRLADREYQRIYEEIKSSSPLWNSLFTDGGETAGLQTVQRELVGDRQGLLLYQIGQERSYVFLVSPGDSGLQTFPLRLGSEAEKAAIQPGPLTSSKLSRLLAGATTDAMGSISQLAELPDLSKVLADALIPADVWARMREYQEVVLIPDGILHFLPFEMLVMRTAEGGNDPVYWLDEGPPIRYASSATTLLNLDQRGRSGQNGVLSLSNPRFNASFGSQVNQKEESVLNRAMMGAVLDDLPGSARETEHVLKAFPSARVLQGEAATESELRRELPDQAYLHLATHGLVDERRRSLFSALALTPPPEVAGSDNDGLLQLYEIYDLDLTGVELAVLSACQTNVGPRVNGDGVFALSRGFVAAGARRVIASQWRVDDESAAELIGSFFRRLAAASQLAEKPVDYAQLLREAKRELRRQDRWSNPRFWAPFILIGAR